MCIRWGVAVWIALASACVLEDNPDFDTAGHGPASDDTAGTSLGSTGASTEGGSTEAGSSEADSSEGGADTGALVQDLGCSDGTREAFIDVMMHPNIAGCSGGFAVQGVSSPESMQPMCSRVAGNSSIDPYGTGCSVEDMCADGWRVCSTADEFAVAAPDGCDLTGSDPGFWVTRQSTSGSQCAPGGLDNLIGCGSIGMDAPTSCGSLNRMLVHTDCFAHPPWACGGNAQSKDEAMFVAKDGPAKGGVLCCRWKPALKL